MKHIPDAPVKIEIPPIRVTVADLAYMKSLRETGVRCHVKQKVRDTLLFLGLVEEAEIPPCPKALARYQEERPKLLKRARKAVEEQNWRDLYEVAYRLRNDRKPEPRRDLVLTNAGRQLLRSGEAKSTTAKTKACL